MRGGVSCSSGGGAETAQEREWAVTVTTDLGTYTLRRHYISSLSYTARPPNTNTNTNTNTWVNTNTNINTNTIRNTTNNNTKT